MLAGVVALLPLGGAVLTVAWLEYTIASSWRGALPFYFPGLGLLLVACAIYAVGLFVTTFAGRWLWSLVERVVQRIPLLGSFYDSLKQVLGYDTPRERFFRGVVAVAVEGGLELGLVTGETVGPGGEGRSLVFVPGSPNPTTGRLLLVETAKLQQLDMKVADALRAQVSLGKSQVLAQG
jgi:uncharacterized membrane protein